MFAIQKTDARVWQTLDYLQGLCTVHPEDCAHLRALLNRFFNKPRVRARSRRDSDTTNPHVCSVNPLGRTIHQRRKELKLTLQQVAERAGCTKGYLSTLENEARETVPSAEMLRRIEKALHMDDGQLVVVGEWKATPSVVRARVIELEQQTLAARRLAEVLQREGVDRAFKSGELAKLVRTLEPGAASASRGTEPLRGPQGDRTRRTPGAVNATGSNGSGGSSGESESGGLRMMGVLPMQVPVINKVAAGYPRAFTDPGYPARVADEYVSVPDMYDADAFAARVIGDSMEPVYRQGDIVVFSPMTATLDGCDCFVRFEHNDESTFKRVYFEGSAGDGEGAPTSPESPGKPDANKRIRLQPLNPAYPARVVDREQIAGLYAAVYVVRAVGKGGAK